MAKNSNIEWTNHTFNPWRGCTKVSQGCANCYAEALSGRNPGTLGVWGPKGTRVVASESMWAQPLTWNKAAKNTGVRARVFCASLADAFEGPQTMPAECWPKIKGALLRLLELIRVTPWLDWQLLTKRPENIWLLLVDAWHTGDCSTELKLWLEQWLAGNPPANVWLGTSVEDDSQRKRIADLIAVPARVHFLSCEPLLGSLDLQLDRNAHVLTRTIGEELDWVICGGESGPKARPMHPDWARGLRDQCLQANVPFFFKQWGEWIPKSHANGLTSKEWGALGFDGVFSPMTTCWNGHDDDGTGEAMMLKVSKKTAGRSLDGREWNEVPSTSP